VRGIDIVALPDLGELTHPTFCCKVDGDVAAAKRLIAGHRGHLREVEIGSDAILTDVDATHLRHPGATRACSFPTLVLGAGAIVFYTR
jgi:hypothetical protein